MKELYINRNDERTFRTTYTTLWKIFKIIRPINFVVKILEIGKTDINDETVGDIIEHTYLIRNNASISVSEDYTPKLSDFEFYTFNKEEKAFAFIKIIDGEAIFCMPPNGIYEIHILNTKDGDYLELLNGLRSNERTIEKDDTYETLAPTVRRTFRYDDTHKGIIYEDYNSSYFIGPHSIGFTSSDLGETRTIRFRIDGGESFYIELFVSVSSTRSSIIELYAGNNSNTINVKTNVRNRYISWDDVTIKTYNNYLYVTIKQGSRLYINQFSGLNKMGTPILNYSTGVTVPPEATTVNVFDGSYYSYSQTNTIPDYEVGMNHSGFGVCYYDKSSDILRRYDGLPYNNNIKGSDDNLPIDLDLNSAGFTYFNTTYNKPIWWNGSKWVGVDGLSYKVLRSGTFANKPTGVDVGYAYFCTDKQTTEGSTNGIMIYYKGSNTWVDALGRVIS